LRLDQHRFGVATKARCTVGQDTPWAWVTWATERVASPIPAPIAVRNRWVVRARAVTCAMASVNEGRPQ